MNGFFEPVLSQLVAGLESAEAENNLVRRYDRCLKLVKAAIAELKRSLQASPFPGKEEEVYYFREQVPVIYSRLFYFMKLRLMETHRAHLSRERFLSELQREMWRIEDFYDRHRQLQESTHGDHSYWDGCLFTRQGGGDWWAEEEGLYIDEDFTIGSYWVAKTMANGALKKWLVQELARPEAPVSGSLDNAAAKPELRFTGKKVYFVEFVLALHLTGYISDGKLTFKDTIERFAEFLHLDLGDFNVTIQEMARRKISVAKFLELMAEKLREKLAGMG